MPRVVRDYDDETELKNCTRRTRATAAINVTDSPVRRNTRSNKQLTTVNSSPESVDESNAQSVGPTTRSRVATLDKGMAAVAVKNLRSRKASGSSDMSESMEIENDTVEKRVTRRNKISQSTAGTPTKSNLRSRAIRAGSEAKSTPPSRNKRVTRSSSVDPVININESLGTPIKRRTRASIVPTEPTVTEDEETVDKANKSLDCTVIKINENDSDNSTISPIKKSIKDSSSTLSDIIKETSVVKSCNNSEKFTLDASKKFEESLTHKSKISNESIQESPKKPFNTIFIDNALEFSEFETNMHANVYETKTELFVSSTHENIFKKQNDISILNNRDLSCKEVNDKVNFKSSKNIKNTSYNNINDETEYINVDEFTESSSNDESDILVDISENRKKKPITDDFDLNIKSFYIKLDRTNTIEKLTNQKIDENKNNEQTNNVSKGGAINDSVITNVKTAIVLIDDCIKNNQNIHSNIYNTKSTLSILQDPLVDIENSKTDISFKDDLTSINNSNNKNLNTIFINDKTEKIVRLNSNINKKENLITIVNHNETKNDDCIKIGDDESKNLISIIEKSKIPKNESNNEISNLNSVNSNNKEEKSILLIESKSKMINSIFANSHNDEKENSLSMNKNFNLSINSDIENAINKENECSFFTNKNENENSNLFFMDINKNKKENSIILNENAINEIVHSPLNNKNEHQFVNSVAEECDNSKNCTNKTKNLVYANDKCDETKDVLHSSDSVETTNICDERNNLISIKSSNSLSISMQSNDAQPESVSVNKIIDKSSNVSFDRDNNESINLVSANQINNLSHNSDKVNDKIICTSISIEHKNDMEIDKNIESMSKPLSSIPRQFNDAFNKSVFVHKIIDKSSNISFCEDNNDSIGSVCANQINNLLHNSNDINDKMDCASFVNKCTNNVKSDEKLAELIPEKVVNNIDNEATLEPRDFNILDETGTDSKQSKICGVDKNSMSYAVTDADGENASTPTKLEENNEFNENDKSLEKSLKTTQTKSSQERKRKTDDSDSSDSAANLFQDIPADEWLNDDVKQNRSLNSENYTEDQNKSETSDNNASINRKNTSNEKYIDDSRTSTRKLLIEKEQLNNSSQNKLDDEVVDKTNESPTKRTSTSVGKKRQSNHSINLSNSKSNTNISEIQEDDIDSDKDENKSPNKSRQSINRSTKLNKSSLEQHKNESMLKTNKSFESSFHITQSSFEGNLNDTVKMNNSETGRKSITTISLNSKEQLDENSSDEAMDVDEETQEESQNEKTDNLSLDKSKNVNKSVESMEIDEENENDKTNNVSLNKSKKELNIIQLNNSLTSNKSIFEKSSTCINDSKISENVLRNTSLSNLLIENDIEENSFSDEIDVVDDDENKKLCKENSDQFEVKSRRSSNKYNLSNQLNKSDSPNKNESFIEEPSNSLNNSKISRNQSLNEKTPCKSLTMEQVLENESDDEIEIEDTSVNKKYNSSLNKSSDNKSFNSSGLNEESVFNMHDQVSFKNKDKLVKETSHIKVDDETESDEDISSQQKTKFKENTSFEESLNKFTNKSVNISPNSCKSTNNISIKYMFMNLVKDSTQKNIDNTEESASNSNLSREADTIENNDQSELNINKSIPKNTEKVEQSPVNQNLSKTINFETNSESEHNSECKLEISEESENSDDDKENTSNEDIDSDVAKEYNLSGKIIEKYSDDDVRGDDCRASEEELSDSDDNGDDLSGFIVPDDEMEEPQDDSEDEKNSCETEDSEDIKDIEDNEGSEDDEDSEDNEDDENVKMVNSIQEENINKVKLNANESINNSKLKKNESFNHSKSIEDKSIDFSKSIKTKNNISNSLKTDANDSLSIKKKKDSKLQNCKSLNSNFDDELSKDETESESGEDSYQIATVNQMETSCSHSLSTKTKKITPLIECSTPKPGVTKKNDFSKGADSFVDRRSLATTSNNSDSVKCKSESLNDLSDTKMISSRLSMSETASKSIHDASLKFKENVEIVNNLTSTDKRQPWKLIPLNQTVQTLSCETPLTKYLKKSKLNDSAPGSEWRKSICGRLDALPKKNTSKNKNLCEDIKDMQEPEDDNTTSPIDKKLKKRKLQDTSISASTSENSLRVAKKKKKGARIEESVIEQAFKWEVQDTELEDIQKDKKKKKKNQKNVKTEEVIEDVSTPENIEDAQLINPKKKQKFKEIKLMENTLESLQSSENKQTKKKLKNAKLKEDVLESSESPEDNNNKKNKKLKKIKLKENVLESSESPEDKNQKKNKKLQEIELKENVLESSESPEDKNQKKNKKLQEIIKLKENVLGTSENPENKNQKKNKKLQEVKLKQNVLESSESPEDDNQKKNKKLKETKLNKIAFENLQSSEDNKKKKRLKKRKRRENAFENSQSSEDNQKNIKDKKPFDLTPFNEVHEPLNAQVQKCKKKKYHLNEELEQENVKVQKKAKLNSNIESYQKLKKSKRKNRGSSDDKEDELQTSEPMEENIKVPKQSRKKKYEEAREATGLQRLSDDVLENLTDKPLKRSRKRQKLTIGTEQNIVLPSTSMFSPNNRAPVNIRVEDDGYIPLNVDGGTTEFGIVNLEKAKKYTKKNAAVFNFRDRMLNRNPRQPTSTYLMYLSKLNAKKSV